MAKPGTSAANRVQLIPPLAAALLAGLFGLTGWWIGVGPAEQAVLIARYTARVSLGLFVILYVLGPTRRDWLSAFVTAHLMHFATMVHLAVAIGMHMHPTKLALGLAAYAVPTAVLLIPGDARAKWRTIALDYVWLSFAVTYYHRLFEFPDRHEAGVFAFVLLVAALLARIGLAVRRR